MTFASSLQPIEKTSTRRYTQIRVCPRCGGHGLVQVDDERDLPYGEEPPLRQCRLCEGSGMVTEMMTVIKERKPFRAIDH